MNPNFSVFETNAPLTNKRLPLRNSPFRWCIFDNRTFITRFKVFDFGLWVFKSKTAKPKSQSRRISDPIFSEFPSRTVTCGYMLCFLFICGSFWQTPVPLVSLLLSSLLVFFVNYSNIYWLKWWKIYTHFLYCKKDSHASCTKLS